MCGGGPIPDVAIDLALPGLGSTITSAANAAASGDASQLLPALNPVGTTLAAAGAPTPVQQAGTALSAAGGLGAGLAAGAAEGAAAAAPAFGTSDQFIAPALSESIPAAAAPAAAGAGTVPVDWSTPGTENIPSVDPTQPASPPGPGALGPTLAQSLPSAVTVLSGLVLANALRGMLSPSVLSESRGGMSIPGGGLGGGSPVNPVGQGAIAPSAAATGGTAGGTVGISPSQLSALLASAAQNAPHRGLAPPFSQRMGGLPEDPGLAADFTALNQVGRG